MLNNSLKALILALLFSYLPTAGQEIEYVYFDTLDISIHALNTKYKPSRKRIVDIDHMRLEVTPVFDKKSMLGKAILEIHAYNKPVNSVELDAKGMIVSNVGILQPEGYIPTPYTYDDLLLTIELPRTYPKEEQFTLLIEYEAEPYKLNEKGIELSAGRGLYFIDPYDKNEVKPVQMWTQGETNANSVWFPTIDSPNEQFTHDIFITVDDEYKTLSNGLLIKSVINEDGTRTDHWKQGKPHGPHLVMVGAGEFYIQYDSWDSLELSYYTAPEFSNSVQKVFGRTPSIMTFFSELLGVDYPWEKYGQMVVYDYTSGAMENTSAVILYDAYYADEFDLLDRNYDETIVHELAHQWFGDLVACESWAHLALNESFATYCEYLWYEHNNSKQAADHLNHEYLFDYLNEFLYKSEPIVNYYYDDANDLFDSHRYEKGSCVLHMLRDYVGDDDFFAGLQHYLKTYQYGSAEMDNLRLSMEEVSGEDLNWFFDQWFMNEGHPVVEISHSYDARDHQLEVSVKQVQEIDKYITFQFPLSIDIYLNGKAERMSVWVDERKETYVFNVPVKPDLVNVDAKKIMLWEKSEDLSYEEYVYQFYNAPLYVDRLESLNGLRWSQSEKPIRKLFMDALQDEFWDIRKFTLSCIDLKSYTDSEGAVELVSNMALNDPVAQVRRSALEVLSDLDTQYALAVADPMFENDSSRMVKAVALGILFGNDRSDAYNKAVEYSSTNNQYLKTQIANVFAEMGAKKDHAAFKRILWSSRPWSMDKLMDQYVTYLKRMDVETVEEATTLLLDMALYEETASVQYAARNALYDLHDHFSESLDSGSAQKEGLLEKAVQSLP